MHSKGWMSALAMCWGTVCASANAAPSIEDFARLPDTRDVRISPDGRHLLMISANGGEQTVLTTDLDADRGVTTVFGTGDDNRVRILGCDWVDDTRLMCELYRQQIKGARGVGKTHLIAVDRDGTNGKRLFDSPADDLSFIWSVTDYLPETRNEVLVAIGERPMRQVNVMRVNTRSGQSGLEQRGRERTFEYLTDGEGRVRVGKGYREEYLKSFVIDGDRWQDLSHDKAYAEDRAPMPVHVAADGLSAYAIGPHEGRDALWTLDLTQPEAAPTLIAHHPSVDISGVLTAGTREVIGIHIHAERPQPTWLDPSFASIVDQLQPQFPGQTLAIVDTDLQRKRLVIHATGDRHPGSWHVLDLSGSQPRWLTIGETQPALQADDLRAMMPIRFTARDGAEVPGYLTLPAGDEPAPLVVMPHDGPLRRDRWGYDPLVQFLATRGYAVLQINFRGSTGYGDAWRRAAHQDVGGLSYDDIVDGTSWAAARDDIDGTRIGIVGHGFGGYAALLAATRDSGLYRCAASIAGVSDLREVLAEKSNWSSHELWREQLGTDWSKLSLDSPRQHARGVSIPVLLIHGDDDIVVEKRHTDMMVAALRSAGKTYKQLTLEGGDHALWRPFERQRVMTEIERLLASALAERAD